MKTAVLVLGAVLVAGVTVSAHCSTSQVMSASQMSRNERTMIHKIVTNAERERIRRMQGATPEDSDIIIRVEESAVKELMGFRFFRGYDVQFDPAWIYIVALDASGQVFRVRGFETNEYADITQRWVSSVPTIADDEAFLVVNGYFELVEQWSPGIVKTPQEIEAVKNAIAANSVEEHTSSDFMPAGPRIMRSDGSLIVVATVFDAGSLRTECVEVILSEDGGLEVASRFVVIDQPRYRY